MSVKIILFSILFMYVPECSYADSSEKLTLTILYEALCVDCMDLFGGIQKLLRIENIKQKVNFDLVPFGKASMEDGTVFCQHGKPECFFNKIHGCAIEALSSEVSVDFIVCMMNCNDQYRCLFKDCLFDGKIDGSDLLKCTVEDGHSIMNKMGKRTVVYDYVRSFVPTVVINGIFSYYTQQQAIKDITSLVLSHLGKH